MTTLCGQCQDQTRFDVPSRLRLCSGCERVPADCTCRPAAVVPEWIRRSREGKGLGKSLDGRA